MTTMTTITERCDSPSGLPIPKNTGVVDSYFPGPIDGSAFPTDASGTHAEGRDPPTIANFGGFVGQVDLTFSGPATDTKTRHKGQLHIPTDTRFLKGQFVASDEKIHQGTFALI
jgi:hypothetical protein